MSELNIEETTEETIEMPEIEMLKSQVYIRTDEQGYIVRCEGGYSMANITNFEDWILIDEGTGDKYNLCQSHYFEGGLYTMDGIPLYKWDGKQVVARGEDEIEADREARKPVVTLAEVQSAKLAELSTACSQAIISGCDVELSAASGHISLTAEDQINLTAALNTVEQGAAGYPYHLDGQLCAVFSAADIRLLAQAATSHKLYHTTYYNHLAAWVRRSETTEEVQAITYGTELPEDLAANMANILGGVETENEEL